MHGYVSEICVHHKVPKLKSADAAKKDDCKQKDCKRQRKSISSWDQNDFGKFNLFLKEKLMI